MSSIPQTIGQKQAPILAYKYALKVTPDMVKRMDREQLQQLCLEQMFLLWLIIAIIRNPLAALASRIIAVDLFISFVEKNVRGTLKEITERSRVYISGDGGIAKRLGIHANTVSKCLKSLETYTFIQRDYVYDEAKQKEYLDVTITVTSLNQPFKLQDKTARMLKEAGKKQAAPDETVSPATSLVCPSCGSSDVIITCRSCGTTERPLVFMQQSAIPANNTVIVEADDPTSLLHKIYVVDTNNTPLTRDDLECGQADDGAQKQEVSLTLESTRQEGGDVPTEEDADQVLIAWLGRRLGHGKLIYATGSPEYSKKYYNKPAGYHPDYPAYLAGDKRHILGSYLSHEDGSTLVLAFDIDDPDQHKAHLVYLRTLAEAGASPVYWQRARGRGHLELYFDQPVPADQALSWCISVCPELAGIAECYPAKEKRNQPIAWPFYQRTGERVLVCRARAMLAHTNQVRNASVQNRVGLAALLAQAVTPGALITAAQAPETSTQPEVSLQDTRTPSPLPQATEDLAKAVIAEFNRTTTWDEVVKLCGGFTHDGKFKAVWRNERTPSVAIDANGQFASDYGRTAGFPRKLDKYEVWCLAQGGLEFKRFDLARRMEAYRKQLEQTGDSPPPVPLQPEEQKAPLSPPEEGVQPRPDETGEEVVARLQRTGQHTNGRVMTPKGPGTIWQLWPSRIGIVLDGDPEHVRFFTEPDEMRRIVAIREDREGV